VVDEENLLRGTLVGLFDFGAGEVADIQIEGKKQNVMLPFVAPFLMDVNLEARSIQMQFAALEGDDEAEEDGVA
jgi:ribosomal 30S subunit maturation factor RimM